MKKILPLIILTLIFAPLFIVFAEPATPTAVDPWQAISRITSLVFGALIALAVVFIIISAFFFVTASGNEEQVKKARNMLMWAIMGIVVAVLAQGIVNWLRSFLETGTGAV